MSTEYRRSLRSELSRTASRWHAAFKLFAGLSGYASAIILWARGAHNWQVVVAAALGVGVTCLLLYLAAQAAWENENDARLKAEAERDKLLDDLKPKFRIVFQPIDDDNSRPYVQSLRYLQPHPERGMLQPRTMLDRRYRVGVVNLSSATVPAVTMTLHRCEPAQNFVHLDHHLLVMDSDPRADTRDLPPSKNGEPTLFFDIVNEHGKADRIPDHFLFCYANERIVGSIPPGTYDITLHAQGGGATATATFRVSKLAASNGSWARLTMKAL